MCGCGSAPKNLSAGRVVAEITMVAHTGVGDDGEAGTHPVPGSPGLLVLGLNAALDDNQVYLGSWVEKGRPVEVEIVISGSWGEVGHPEVGEPLSS